MRTEARAQRRKHLAPSVLGAGAVGKAAGVGFVDEVQEVAVGLDQVQQRGLELALRESWDPVLLLLLLLRVS